MHVQRSQQRNRSLHLPALPLDVHFFLGKERHGRDENRALEMKWLKHMTAANRDEKLMLLRDEFGMEGYGIYWVILEVISEQITPEKPNPELTLPERKWQKICEISPKKFRKLLEFCKKVELFFIFPQKTIPGTITIKCPNLSKFHDEYTSRRVKRNG